MSDPHTLRRRLVTTESRLGTPQNTKRMSTNSCSDFLKSISIGTLLILCINCTVEVVIFLTSANIGYFALSANYIFQYKLYYTLLSWSFVHVNLMHIGFNMMSLLQLGPILEAQFGTSQFLYMSLWSVFLCSFTYIILEYLCYCVTGTSSYLGICKQ